MRAPDGGFYSSLDADSEGHEGRFYVWDAAEVRAALLAPTSTRVFAPRYGLDRPPNFEGHAWHLVVAASLETIAGARGSRVERARALLRCARAQAAGAARAARVRPARDEKILTSWNALAIRGLATAARVLDRADCAAGGHARRSRFLRAHHWRDGRLLATSAGGRGAARRLPRRLRFPGRRDPRAASRALRARRARLRRRAARGAAGAIRGRGSAAASISPPTDHETLISRPKTFGDEALPAGNGVAAAVLLRFGYLLGEPRYLAAAERALRAAWPALQRVPAAACQPAAGAGGDARSRPRS